jgi:signal transduction histidine kinase
MSETEVVAGRGASSTMEFQPRPVSLRSGLASLRHRDFRLFWTSQIASLIGTRMQIVAQDWLVLELTGSPFILGVVSALQFLPTLIFALVGGVVADRLPKRSLLLFTQSSAMLLAFVLGTLTWTGSVQVIHVMALAVLLGGVNALDMPTRQAFIVELVGREDLQNGIALNSAAFNSARLVGPAIAGLVIGWVGLAVRHKPGSKATLAEANLTAEELAALHPRGAARRVSASGKPVVAAQPPRQRAFRVRKVPVGDTAPSARAEGSGSATVMRSEGSVGQ